MKGVQNVDLSWSDSQPGTYDVYRDDTLLVAAVGGTTYTDDLGVKGGGNYTYRVCRAGTTTCSNTTEVTF